MNLLRHLSFLISVTLSAALAGANNAVYLHEGFNLTTMPPGWSHVRIAGVDASWSIVAQGTNPPILPFAGSGQAKFNSWDAAANEQARLISPAISLNAAPDPFLSFWMYHEDEYLSSFDSVYVEISTTDSVNGPWTILRGVRRPGVRNAWVQEAVSLFPWRGATRLFVSLRGVSKYGNNIFIDEFRIADSSFHDLGITALLTGQANTGAGMPVISGIPRIGRKSKVDGHSFRPNPRDVAVGSALQLQAVVRNFGTFDETSYAVQWRINQQLQPAVAGGPISARTGRDTLTLNWSTPVAGVHTITSWTAVPGDSTRSNDSVQITLNVVDTATVFYESFNGNGFPPQGWITINRDNGSLAPWFRGADTSAFLAFEGSGFAANNYLRANSTYLDDYLITPQITGVNSAGKVDSLIFWVRSVNNLPPAANFPDSLLVSLSTGGFDTASFTTTLEYFSVPKTGWTRKGYSLSGRSSPNSTMRIAFRYLLRNVQLTSGSGDFIGIDAVQVVRKVPTDVTADNSVPNRFSLEQNYPNPFNPSTRIAFSVPDAGAKSMTTLKVFDILGREIATLLHGELNAGYYQVNFSGEGFASGVYVYRLQTTERVASKRMMLLR